MKSKHYEIILMVLNTAVIALMEIIKNKKAEEKEDEKK